MSDSFDAERMLEGALAEKEIKELYQKLQSSGEQLYFNGINGATGAYAVPSMTGEQLAAVIKGEAQPENLGELGQKGAPGAFPIKPPNDPTKLEDAGWAVIFPAKSKDTPKIEEALSELLALRKKQAGARFKIYKKGDGHRPGETTADFFKRHKISRGPADPEQLPYYVLLVASPDEIPFEFQYQLDVMRGVGRIHFDALEDYANYARNVVLAETGKVKLPRRASFFGVANLDDKATQLSAKYLVSPLHKRLQKCQPFARWVEQGDVRRKLELDWQFEAFLAKKATKAQLGRLLGGDQTPAMLFTASHGMEFPLGDPRQLLHQGALLCQDWPGPDQWRGAIGQDFYFAGDDITSDANLLGLIAFHFACFGAGTPRQDQFAKQAGKQERVDIAPHNFVGALPKSLLTHGALAVIGHVERAWGYSIQSPGLVDETGVFESTLLQLLSGDPVGWITENLNMSYADLATQLAAILEELEYDEGYINPYELAGMWTAHNDARGHVVIGDPAARLPVALPDETPQERPALDTVSISFSTKAGAVSSASQLAGELAPKGAAVESFGLFGIGDDDDGESWIDSFKKVASDLSEALSRALDDVSSLEITTYTSDDLEGVQYDKENRKLSGQMRRRALTRISFDGDTQVCLPQKDDGKVDRELWQIHLAMVQEAQANRTEFIKTMADFVARLAGR